MLGRAVPLDKAAAGAAAKQMLPSWLSFWTTPHGGPAGGPGFGAGVAGGSGTPAASGLATAGMPAVARPDGVVAARRGGLSAVSGGLGGLGTLGGFRGGADPLRGSELLLSLSGGQEDEEGSGPGR